jgi:hypothetical protein
LLFDELTMSSSSGFFALNQSKGGITPIANAIHPLIPSSLKIISVTGSLKEALHVKYTVVKPGSITISIADLNGRIYTQKSFYYSTPGSYSSILHMSACSEGLYMMQIKSGQKCDARKLVLVK